MAGADLMVGAEALAELEPSWDALAVAGGRPMSSPAWMLGQWRHLRPEGSELRVAVVRDGDELVAIAPLYAERKRAGRLDLRLLGAAMPRAGPLSLPGREWDAAGPIARALAAARPRADLLALESAPLSSHWPDALAERWPGPLRPAPHRYFVQSSPTASLAAGSFDAWLAGRSPRFRAQARRARRELAEAGGSVRTSTHATLHADVQAFMRLHAARWEGRGASAIVARRAELAALYEEVGRAHLDSGRLRLYLVELEGEPIAAQLVAAAGGEALALNGGWDERHARLRPSLLGLLAAVEDAIVRGDARLDLGPGDGELKRRVADGDDPVCWSLMVLPRPRMPVTRARVTPMMARIRAREAVRRALPPDQADRLRELRARVRG